MEEVSPGRFVCKKCGFVRDYGINPATFCERTKALNEAVAAVHGDPELPGPMPWRNKLMYLRYFVTGRWARYHRCLCSSHKRQTVELLERLRDGN